MQRAIIITLGARYHPERKPYTNNAQFLCLLLQSQSYKTVVVHKTLNPEYNQMFTFFGVSAESLDNKALV